MHQILYLKRLRQQYCDDTKGFEHLYFCSRINNNLPKYLKLDKYVDKILHLYRKKICQADKQYVLFVESIEKQVNREQEYFDSIMKNIEEENRKCK